MKVIGFGLNKISANKSELKDKNLKISSNIEVKEVSKEKIENFAEEALKIEFSFTIKYEPKFAEIEIVGYVIMTLNSSQAKDAVKKWKNKKIPDEIRLPLFNFILSKCNLKALQLEEELTLPTHIPMPRLSNQQQGNNRSYVQ